MIRSMTGYGRAEDVTPEHKVTVELKSVNHRYLDLGIKLPRKLSFFEGAVRNLLKTYMSRGKVDVYISYEDYTIGSSGLKYNKELAAEYVRYFHEMAMDFNLANDMAVSALVRCPEVLTMEEASMDEEKLWEILEVPLREACEKFVRTREQEGENLKRDILEKLENLEQKVSLVEERSPLVVAAYREKLEAKVKEIMTDSKIEEARIAAEVVIYADKICNDEETVRLKSHIRNMMKIMKESEGVGRKLDFMAQEMNREANTILSKSNDLEVSNIAIELKTEIEKIREQIQNIE